MYISKAAIDKEGDKIEYLNFKDDDKLPKFVTLKKNSDFSFELKVDKSKITKDTAGSYTFKVITLDIKPLEG